MGICCKTRPQTRLWSGVDGIWFFVKLSLYRPDPSLLFHAFLKFQEAKKKMNLISEAKREIHKNFLAILNFYQK